MSREEIVVVRARKSWRERGVSREERVEGGGVRGRRWRRAREGERKNKRVYVYMDVEVYLPERGEGERERERRTSEAFSFVMVWGRGDRQKQISRDRGDAEGERPLQIDWGARSRAIEQTVASRSREGWRVVCGREREEEEGRGEVGGRRRQEVELRIEK